MSVNNIDQSQDNKQSAPLSADSKGADAQILAHRHQHQAKLKKIILLALSVALIAIVFVVVVKTMSTTTETGEGTSKLTPVQSLSEVQIAQYRDQFKQALTHYEVNIQPPLNVIRVLDWEAPRVNALSLLKEHALTAFAQGAFLQANTHLTKLVNDSQVLVKQWQTETQSHLDSAQQAFENNQIAQAQLKLNKALALMPSNQDALNLQNRIDAYAEISGLLSALEVAKVENNLPKQIDLLADIIQLDPERIQYNDDLSDAIISHDKIKFAKLLEQADQAMANNQIKTAEQFIQQALVINPSSKGARALTTRIEQQKSNQYLARVKESLALLQAQDEWLQIKKLVDMNVDKYPNDSDLKTYQTEMRQVLSAHQSLDIFVQKPERLADKSIRDAATDSLQKAFKAALLSPSLQQKIAQVGSTIDKYTYLVNVNIKSDGNTYIVVVGVGHVGQHTQKTVELTPGDYVLLGKREGYRNKRVEFTVAPGKPMDVTLICDEAL